jgi:hypothetical protein
MEGTKGGKQYGLQLRVKAPPKKPARPVPAFSFDDGAEEDTVEDAIARQATKKRSVREVSCFFFHNVNFFGIRTTSGGFPAGLFSRVLEWNFGRFESYKGTSVFTSHLCSTDFYFN